MVGQDAIGAPGTARRRGFLETVRVEDLARQWEWGWKDWATVAMVPLILGLDFLPLEKLPGGALTPALVDVSLRVVFCALLIALNAPLLARHWRAFKGAFWRSMGLVVVGLVVIQVLISALKPVLTAVGGITQDPAGEGPDPDLIRNASLLAALYLSLGPTATALIEDFTFRHTLLVKLPVWRPVALGAVAVVVNALLFGAAHINNFDGHLILTLSYAAAGLFMNLVYLWTRNIWHVLLMHGLNNFILLGPVTMLFVKLMEGATAA